jgi:hypothetical protein
MHLPEGGHDWSKHVADKQGVFYTFIHLRALGDFGTISDSAKCRDFTF